MRVDVIVLYMYVYRRRLAAGHRRTPKYMHIVQEVQHDFFQEPLYSRCCECPTCILNVGWGCVPRERMMWRDLPPWSSSFYLNWRVVVQFTMKITVTICLHDGMTLNCFHGFWIMFFMISCIDFSVFLWFWGALGPLGTTWGAIGIQTLPKPQKIKKTLPILRWFRCHFGALEAL